MSNAVARPKPRICTVKEACQYAKISKSQLYVRLAAGEVKAYKRHGTTLIDMDSLDAMNSNLPEWKPVGGSGPRRQRQANQ
ncbi:MULTISPECIES: helix-turn-helix domain-containing protein [unclassified Bradyrhizobium]|uniref:helix-turn-helix domain-containing protein n=1 Tax=unclassified Bradyrhizobium TaxID=2631580 RepID=UPI0029161FAE|nr:MULTISPECIES: helix-turn-helix domain-containing protein [unclassified Bradyrhizobium]